ncbi:MAG: peptidylprolyl isomerase [Candidatus Scalindua sp.]|jgi:FKBP-type peptidyl-prolyl cis-trans isomerase SlyD|nr:peptidylprolyl isomerase [Candidatus Scalindua sp.]MBT5305611.1 peptidylprolyl isomerase [Candidatus Scalindua sp.]MBT6051361.1 peptidylprolyl isomerase [Candidatus Scalindua sp.]MBT6231619.1 peptidylprolyl isomerase [Candidatus Scalindua sp.]MBT7210388.1 peptidylprolyl isomerase [Candidatus Scalindua sp.]
MKRFRSGKSLILCIIFCIFSSSVAFTDESRESASDTSVSPGKKVSIEYALKLEDKSVIDSNVGAGPLTFMQGSHELLPALENALEGMKIGECKQITVMPEEGYGPVDKNAVIELDKEQFLQDELEIGTVLQSLNSDGQPIYAQVAEIKEKTILLDFNHPLAGKTLYFDIKILDIQEVPKS